MLVIAAVYKLSLYLYRVSLYRDECARREAVRCDMWQGPIPMPNGGRPQTSLPISASQSPRSRPTGRAARCRNPTKPLVGLAFGGRNASLLGGRGKMISMTESMPV